MSSRNTYLNPEERRAALVLSKSLAAAQSTYEKGERDATTLRRIMEKIINTEPLARLEYVSCADYDTLEEMSIISKKALISMAVYLGKTRLIDNVVLE